MKQFSLRELILWCLLSAAALHIGSTSFHWWHRLPQGYHWQLVVDQSVGSDGEVRCVLRKGEAGGGIFIGHIDPPSMNSKNIVIGDD